MYFFFIRKTYKEFTFSFGGYFTLNGHGAPQEPPDAFNDLWTRGLGTRAMSRTTEDIRADMGIIWDNDGKIYGKYMEIWSMVIHHPSSSLSDLWYWACFSRDGLMTQLQLGGPPLPGAKKHILLIKNSTKAFPETRWKKWFNNIQRLRNIYGTKHNCVLRIEIHGWNQLCLYQ